MNKIAELVYPKKANALGDICYASELNLLYKGQAYQRCTLKLYKHFLFVDRRILGLTLSVVHFHLFDVQGILVLDPSTVRISLISGDAVLKDICANECVEMLYKLLMESIGYLPRNFLPRCENYSIQATLPDLTAEDAFSSAYSAFCSFYSVKCNQRVCDYVRRLIHAEDHSFCLNDLPPSVFEESQDLRPISAALMNFTPINDLDFSNSFVENSVKAAALTLSCGDHIKFLHFQSTRCLLGLSEICKALDLSNHEIEVINLSNNSFSDFHSLVAYLPKLTSLRSLMLDDCHIPTLCVDELLFTLSSNVQFSQLKQFSILGATISSEGSILLSNFIESAPHLELLRVGNFIEEVKLPFNSLGDIEELAITNSRFGVGVFKVFLDFLSKSHLKSLDLSNFQLSSAQYNDILLSMERNSCIITYALSMQKLFNPTAFFQSLDETVPSKLIELNLDGSAFQKKTFDFMAKVLTKLRCLVKLSLNGCNFSNSDLRLITKTSITQLSIKDNPNAPLLDLFKTISKSKRFVSLDISNNQLGDEGYKILTEIVDTSPLTEVHFDGLLPSSISSLRSILSSIEHSEISVCDFPFTDLHFLAFDKWDDDRQKIFAIGDDLHARFLHKLKAKQQI